MTIKWMLSIHNVVLAFLVIFFFLGGEGGFMGFVLRFRSSRRDWDL